MEASPSTPSGDSASPPAQAAEPPAPAATTPPPALAAAAHLHAPHQGTALLALGALGVVYGDIGTSPLYAMRECFHMLHTDASTPAASAIVQVYGVLSLVTWALVSVVVVKYLALALRADNQGEGGILALLALLTAGTPSSPGSGGLGEGKPQQTRRTVVIVLALMAGALLFADGMITPAISVLSAIEGIEVAAPGMHRFVLPITVMILAAVFLIQRFGTGRIGGLFGPLTMLWFGSIGILGLIQVVQHPAILAAANPWYAFRLVIADPGHSFLLLGSVVLVVTGGEALYADMGHFGRRAIRVAWYAVVMPALLLNYYGQAAAVMVDPAAAANPFWAIVPQSFQIPMLIIATLATIIASQALISGAYSLANQAVQLGYSPRLHVIHTSSSMKGQIYVPEINYIMMVACIMLVLLFRSSSALAAMYGLAVTGTMAITSILLYHIAVEKWRWARWRARSVLGVFLAIDLVFFASNLLKLHHGGWVALAVAAVVFTIMFTWYEGRAILARPAYSISLPLAVLMKDLTAQRIMRVPGTAVFMAARPGVVPAVMLHHLKHNQVLHERVVMLSVRTTATPKVAEEDRITVKDLEHGFFEVNVSYGFQESPDVSSALHACKAKGLTIDPDMASYYVGRVTLRIGNHRGLPSPFKRLFAFLYLNERPVTSFFNLPANRVVELGRQLEL